MVYHARWRIQTHLSFGWLLLLLRCFDVGAVGHDSTCANLVHAGAREPALPSGAAFPSTRSTTVAQDAGAFAVPRSAHTSFFVEVDQVASVGAGAHRGILPAWLAPSRRLLLMAKHTSTCRTCLIWERVPVDCIGIWVCMACLVDCRCAFTLEAGCPRISHEKRDIVHDFEGASESHLARLRFHESPETS